MTLTNNRGSAYWSPDLHQVLSTTRHPCGAPRRTQPIMLALKIFFAAVFGIPVALVFAGAFFAMRSRRVLVAAACSSSCPRCAAPLSEDSVASASAMWERHMRVLRERNPGVMFRIVRRMFAICDACGARLTFDEKSRRFDEIEITLSFEEQSPQRL